MPRDFDPDPTKNLLTARQRSWMRFMREELVFDKERDSLVRFRGIFQMPNWDGVEGNEVDHLVESSTERLDKIAVRHWGPGTEELLWVIAARNGLDLPDVELYRGRRLKVPVLSWVETKLLSQAARMIPRQQ